MGHGLEERGQVGDGAEVVWAAGGEEEDFVEEAEGGRGRLVDRGYYDQLSPSILALNTVQKQLRSQLTLFCFAMFLMNEITSQLAAESRPLVGSSRNNSFGPVTSWLATLTRRF